jgi:hypothetical protein
MQAFGRKQMLSSAVLQGGGLWRVRNRKWTCLINRPDDLVYCSQVFFYY